MTFRRDVRAAVFHRVGEFCNRCTKLVAAPIMGVGAGDVMLALREHVNGGLVEVEQGA